MGFSPRYALKEVYRASRAVYEEDSYPYKHAYVNRESALKEGCEERIEKMEEELMEEAKGFQTISEQYVSNHCIKTNW